MLLCIYLTLFIRGVVIRIPRREFQPIRLSISMRRLWGASCDPSVVTKRIYSVKRSEEQEPTALLIALACFFFSDSEARPGQAQQWMYHDDLC